MTRQQLLLARERHHKRWTDLQSAHFVNRHAAEYAIWAMCVDDACGGRAPEGAVFDAWQYRYTDHPPG